MNVRRLVISAVFLLLVAGLLFLAVGEKDSQSIDTNNEEAMVETNEHNGDSLTLTSSVFGEGDYIPKKYTCDGEDIHPPLEISGVSEEAESLVLIVEDPDVPKSIREDGMWDHWVKFNIPVDVREIEEGEELDGVSGKGTNGSLNYHGPCPPDKEHRYFFKLFSLDTTLDLPEGASKADVEEAMTGHVLQKTELVGLYERE